MGVVRVLQSVLSSALATPQRVLLMSKNNLVQPAPHVPRFKSRYGSFELELVEGTAVIDRTESNVAFYTISYPGGTVEGECRTPERLSANSYTVFLHTYGLIPKRSLFAALIRAADTERFITTYPPLFAPGFGLVCLAGLGFLSLLTLLGHWLLGVAVCIGIGLGGGIRLRRQAAAICKEAERAARADFKTRQTMSSKVRPQPGVGYEVTECDLRQTAEVAG